MKFQLLQADRWDQLADSSPDAWLNHSSSWVAIEERFFVNANLSFAIVDRDEVVAIQPLFLSEGAGTALGERLLHSGIHRHTGLALALNLSANRANAAKHAAIKEIFALAEVYDADRIQLNSHNLTLRNRSRSREEIPFWVERYGFQLGIAFGPGGMVPCPGVATVNADQLLDLELSEEVLFQNLRDRASVRQATKQNLTFEITSDIAALKHYMAIAEASSERTGEPVPQYDYYSSVLNCFGPKGRAHIAFASTEGTRVAGLILLTDKGAASYFANVSLPNSLHLRPNDFLHWSAILWAKNVGLRTYRFGPSFPEVPREWPISRVSRFKTKFGSRSVPVIQGSLFRRPERYLRNFQAFKEQLAEVGRLRPVSSIPAEQGAVFVAHLLRVFGFPLASASRDGGPLVLYRPQSEDVSRASDVLARGGSIVAVLPAIGFAEQFGVRPEARTVDSPRVLQAEMAGQKPWKRLRTLHSYMRFVATEGVSVVTDDEGQAAWLCLRTSAGGSIIFVGTDIVLDVVRYRQGDPAAASKRPTEPLWGIAGERPNYLFEGQLAGESVRERPADWWCEALADALVRLCGRSRLPILPNGAVGAVVITGDDDQAALSRYAQQREALGTLPVTYFLHPLTKHTPETLKQLKVGRKVELGIHPDALEHPDKYAELFFEQARWFERLTGERARTVRNHGFLNDGYWGHASAWNADGIRGSSNLPGLDGAIINGSLLPARLMLDDKLTEHWSILTAIGDGIVFINDWDDRQSADCILGLADRIRQSGVPGVIVVNLHPENIEKTRGMHQAVVKLVEDGFIPWTMTECFDWFGAGVDRSPPADASGGKRPSVAEKVRRLLRAN